MQQKKRGSTLPKTKQVPWERSAAQFERAFLRSGLNAKTVRLFRAVVYKFYEGHGRELPWRRTKKPYHILVSEMMLQQTQVGRVMDKYPLFLKRFPDFNRLAQSSLRSVLRTWQGLGYNRRAAHLRKAAQLVASQWHGRLPRDAEKLVTLPGVGRATAGAILAYAFNQPVVFIETNIRTVFLHFFFKNKRAVADAAILPLIEKTMDKKKSRVWYYALMDFGAMLKKQYGNPNWRSAHHTRQSRFHGSDRQIRGMILRSLVRQRRVSLVELARGISVSEDRLRSILARLEKEQLISRKDRFYSII
jgi:A/G-specific adenine glycosylase